MPRFAGRRQPCAAAGPRWLAWLRRPSASPTTHPPPQRLTHHPPAARPPRWSTATWPTRSAPPWCRAPTWRPGSRSTWATRRAWRRWSSKTVSPSLTSPRAAWSCGAYCGGVPCAHQRLAGGGGDGKETGGRAAGLVPVAARRAHPPTHLATTPCSHPARRLGNTKVERGDENPMCSQAQSLPERATLPIQCVQGGQPGVGRYLTVYRKGAQASDMYICQVLVFLAGALARHLAGGRRGQARGTAVLTLAAVVGWVGGVCAAALMASGWMQRSPSSAPLPTAHPQPAPRASSRRRPARPARRPRPCPARRRPARCRRGPAPPSACHQTAVPWW